MQTDCTASSDGQSDLDAGPALLVDSLLLAVTLPDARPQLRRRVGRQYSWHPRTIVVVGILVLAMPLVDPSPLITGSSTFSSVMRPASAKSPIGASGRTSGVIGPSARSSRITGAAASAPDSRSEGSRTTPIINSRTSLTVMNVAPTLQMATVIESVRLRSGPGIDAASYGTLPPDTQLAVLDQQSDWYQVRSPHGTVGWVSALYVALDTNAVPPHPSMLAAAHPAVRLAQQYVGAPYLWGGASPSGFDCSGFTRFIYRQLGVYLPRRARQQFNTWYGAAIDSLDVLAPGDLVFFERTTDEGGITHVGIYVGDGRMIAARTEQLGVRYVNVYEPFWRTRFVGGLRVAY